VKFPGKNGTQNSLPFSDRVSRIRQKNGVINFLDVGLATQETPFSGSLSFWIGHFSLI
jgi:hypothetical protein